MHNLLRLSDASNGSIEKLTVGAHEHNQIQVRLLINEKIVFAPSFDPRCLELEQSRFDEYLSPHSAEDKHWIWHLLFSVKTGSNQVEQTVLEMFLPKRDPEGLIQLVPFTVTLQFFPPSRDYV
jgi:hypothetical protein